MIINQLNNSIYCYNYNINLFILHLNIYTYLLAIHFFHILYKFLLQALFGYM